ncbi:hypothetical protein [Caballeronia insecticola]|uniref:Uncharacterized protein n=1 Tax=Caballeronia insecticola TaxID=758793 RepID=R4WH18_9BURK|nr:hypothetical protein [Caballeronia insecticola]BAN23249.1 hypothetical protein BRPE64_ACDS14950 [Caballeronia insecticola]
MRRTHFATVIVTAALAVSATSVFARDDGPRFAQDRLDAIVAQHQEASRHIAQTPSQEKRAQHKTQQGAS